MIPEIEVVINTDFGGFRLDEEMALWLIENKNWKVAKYSSEDYDPNGDHDLVDLNGPYIIPKEDNIAFRTNKDLIECIKYFKDKYKLADYVQRLEIEKHGGKVFDLKVVKIVIGISIDDYYDGKERVVITSREL